MRLGSPAPAFGAADAGSWFDQFMAGAATRGYRVDFIALHWYGSDFSAAATGQLRSYLQATYNRYHKPIWLTEYALINFSGRPKYPTQTQQAAFVTASCGMLECLSFVERYAWFALPGDRRLGHRPLPRRQRERGRPGVPDGPLTSFRHAQPLGAVHADISRGR